MNTVGSVTLAAHFENDAPEHPTFSAYCTRESRPQAVQEALTLDRRRPEDASKG